MHHNEECCVERAASVIASWLCICVDQTPIQVCDVRAELGEYFRDDFAGKVGCKGVAIF